MRILRGQSNLEVSSTGFALFVVGVVLATFLGGAARTALRSEQVHTRIVNELRARFPKQDIQIGATEVLLSRGIWPGIGLKVEGLSMKQDVCGHLSFVLNIPHAVLPLSLWSLWNGRLRLNSIEIDGGEMHLDYRDCPRAEESGREKNEAHAKTPAEAPAHRSIQTPHIDWSALAQYMDGLDLKNFTITYEKNPTWKLVFTSAYLALGRDIAAQAVVDVEKSLPFGTLSHVVDFELRGDSSIMQWNVSTDFKEGHVRVNGSVDPSSEAGLVKVIVKQMPIKDLMSELYQMGAVGQDLKLKATWLSCTFKWEGHWTSYSEMPIAVRDCRVEGAYGAAELAAADVWLEGPDYFRVPAKFKVSELQLQPVAEALNRQVLPAVLSRLGVWSGTLEFTNKENWKIDGLLSGPEMVFSSQSVHGKQAIDHMHTELQKTSGKIHGQIKNVTVHDGLFDGVVGFELSDDWRTGVFQTRIDRFSLSPAIQKLLVGGSIGPISGQGTGRLENGELADFKGEFSLPDITGEGWHADNVRLRSQFAREIVQIEASARTASVDDSWKYFPQFRQVRMGDRDVKSASWRDLNAKLQVHKGGGSIQNISAAFEPAPGHAENWRGRGSWVRDGEFNAVVFTGSGKPAVLQGENGDLTVQEQPGPRSER